AVSQLAGAGRACNGADQAGRSHLADAIVPTVSDEEITRSIHGYSIWLAQLGRRRRTAVTAEPGAAIACNRADDTGRSHLADAIVADLRDEKVTGSIHRHPSRGVQLGHRRPTAVTAEPGGAIACNRADDARRSHLADALV